MPDQAPEYSMFTTHKRSGMGAVGWIRALVPGDPVIKPDYITQAAIAAAIARDHRAKIGRYATRTVAGVIWVCRLKEDDE